MDPHPITDEEAVAAADKEMEARANRAKELLSQRYVGLKRQQVCCVDVYIAFLEEGTDDRGRNEDRVKISLSFGQLGYIRF